MDKFGWLVTQLNTPKTQSMGMILDMKWAWEKRWHKSQNDIEKCMHQNNGDKGRTQNILLGR